MGKGHSGSRGFTPAAAARIQSATARGNGGQVAKGSFAAKAQSAAAQNASSGSTSNGGK